MAALSADDIRTYVRTALDVEADEVPDALINVWMNEGFDKIVALADRSPYWLHVTYTFDSVVGTQSYDLDTTDGMIDPTPLRYIEDVRGDTWSLVPRSHRQVRARYRQSDPSQARPTDFSVWGRSLYLWGIPTEVMTYEVTGTREPLDWVALGTSPDCPNEFHGLIADYTLARGYAQQDDPDMAQQLLGGWDAQVQKLLVRSEDGMSSQPLQINGGYPREAWRAERSNNLGPLIWTWEDWRTWLQ